MAERYKKIGEMTYDGLVSDVAPQVVVAGGVIGKLAEEGTLKRGTLLSKKDGKLVAFGTSGASADCILCDDTKVGTAADVNAPVYVAGCFDPDKLILGEGKTLAETDKDILRTKGIILKAASAAN